MFISSKPTVFWIDALRQNVRRIGSTKIFARIIVGFAIANYSIFSGLALAADEKKPLKNYSIDQTLQEIELNNRTILNSKRLIGVAQKSRCRAKPNPFVRRV
jgi:hypothetical protein